MKTSKDYSKKQRTSKHSNQTIRSNNGKRSQHYCNQCLFHMFASLILLINVQNVCCICDMPFSIYQFG
jgi:hypothetical protein